MSHTASLRRPVVRRSAFAVAVAGLLTAVAPVAAHAADPVVVTPGSTVCIKATATNGAHAEGQATQKGAAFSVFRNGTLVYLTSNTTGGFAADFTGGGTYKLCASNNNSTNTKVTLTLLGR